MALNHVTWIEPLIQFDALEYGLFGWMDLLWASFLFS